MNKISIPAPTSEPSASAEPKLCPFCGDKPSNIGTLSGITLSVRCVNCGVGWVNVETWNRRADFAEVERLNCVAFQWQEAAKNLDAEVQRLKVEQEQARVAIAALARHKDALQIVKECDAFRTEVTKLTTERDEGLRAATALATSIYKTEYSTTAPNWSPLDYTAGVISQIDNMYAGIRAQRDAFRAEVLYLKEELLRVKIKFTVR